MDGWNGNWTAHNHVQARVPQECLVALVCCCKEPALIFLGEGVRHPNMSAMPTPQSLPSSPDPLAISLSIKANFYDNINFTVEPINSNPMELDGGQEGE